MTHRTSIAPPPTYAQVLEIPCPTCRVPSGITCQGARRKDGTHRRRTAHHADRIRLARHRLYGRRA